MLVPVSYLASAALARRASICHTFFGAPTLLTSTMAATGGGIGMFARMKRQSGSSSINEASTQKPEAFPSASDGPPATSGFGSFSDSSFSLRPPSRESDFGSFGDYDESSNALNTKFDDAPIPLSAPDHTPRQGIALFARRRAETPQISNSLSNNSELALEQAPGINTTKTTEAAGYLPRSNQGTDKMVVGQERILPIPNVGVAASTESFTPTAKPTDMPAFVTPDVSLLPSKMFHFGLSTTPNSSSCQGLTVDVATTPSNKRPKLISEQDPSATLASTCANQTLMIVPEARRVESTKAMPLVNAKITLSSPLTSTFASTPSAAASTPEAREESDMQSSFPASELFKTLPSNVNPTSSSSLPSGTSIRDLISTTDSNDSSPATTIEREECFAKKVPGAILPSNESIEALHADFTLMCREINEKQNRSQAQLLDMEVRFENAFYDTLHYQANFFDLLVSADSLDSDMLEICQVYEHEFDIQVE